MRRQLSIALLTLLLLIPSSFAAPPAFDVILRGGRIVDGSGNPWYLADIGIRDGLITEIGDLSNREAKRTHPISP